MYRSSGLGSGRDLTDILVLVCAGLVLSQNSNLWSQNETTCTHVYIIWKWHPTQWIAAALYCVLHIVMSQLSKAVRIRFCIFTITFYPFLFVYFLAPHSYISFHFEWFFLLVYIHYDWVDSLLYEAGLSTQLFHPSICLSICQSSKNSACLQG